MKIKQNYIAVIATALLIILSGCRSNPVLNIEDAPVEVSGKYTLNDVKKAIIRAGAALGWNMKAKRSGHIAGTLYLRTHVAKIDVRYTKKGYSINYKDSENLNYDGTNIHSNYNNWVQNLNRQIQAQLSTL